MFDPLGIRKLNQRYYSRKGQVNQVKASNNFSGVYIDPSKVQSYKDYLINQRLIHRNEILDPDPDITKESFDIDDIITLQDLFDLYPQDCIPIQARVRSSTNIAGPANFHGWDERVQFISGLVPNAMFTNNWNTDQKTFVKGTSVPNNATGAHEGVRILENLHVESVVEINWKNITDFVCRIEDGDVSCLYTYFFGGGEVNDQIMYTNCDATTHKTTDNGLNTFQYEFNNSTQRNYDLHVDWDRSDPVDITNYDPSATSLGAWVGYYNTNGLGNSQFQQITVLNDLSVDIYYFKYN